MAEDTMETVSRSNNRIFIFADGVPDALSPADTILEMYPDTACTTSIVVAVGGREGVGFSGSSRCDHLSRGGDDVFGFEGRTG